MRLGIAALALALGTPGAAWACGGFFCNQTPVDQSGEDIVFAIDDATGQVTTHIRIAYQGAAEDFAWVVPVAGVPELFLSTEQLFDELSWRTEPVFQAEIAEEGECTGYPGGYGDDWAYSPSAPSDQEDSAGGGVIVVAEQEVGPYDTVVLKATSSAELLGWLQTHGYDLPAELDPVLAPYVAAESYFVALRLQKDKDVGDLAPLGMTYAGTKASIPIQLTSIAATPDLRLRVWVLGDARAVPESYLHVRINEVAIDWLERGDNYEETITRAADQAGGHAFATDYAGPSDLVAGSLWWEGRYDTARLATSKDPSAFMVELISQGFPANTTLLNLLIAYLPPPDGVEPTDFYNCVECYPEHLATVEFDAAGLAAALQEVVVDPLIAAEAMFEAHPWLSRLTSSISPTEMTVDPVFVLNPDLGGQAREHTARMVYLCGNGKSYEAVDRRLELADGRVIGIPSDRWLADRGLTYEDYAESLTEYPALVIEQTGASGQPVTIADHSGEALPSYGALPPTGEDRGIGGGCGCRHVGPLGGVWVLGLLALVGRRRR